MAYKQAKRLYIGIQGEYEGSITLSVHPASTYDRIPHYIGEIAVSITPQSESVQDFAYTGEIAITITPASLYFACAAETPCYEGNISFSILPQSTYNQVFDYKGSISISITPNSEYDRDRDYEGNITVSIEPKSRYGSATHIGWDIYTGWGLADCSFLQYAPPYYVIESLLPIKVNPSADSIQFIKVFSYLSEVQTQIRIESEYSFKYPPVYSHDSDFNIALTVDSEVNFKYPPKYTFTSIARLVCRPSFIVNFRIPEDTEFQHITEIQFNISSDNEVADKKPSILNIESVCSLIIEADAKVTHVKEPDFIYRHISNISLAIEARPEVEAPHIVKIYNHETICKLSLSIRTTDIHIKPKRFNHASVVRVIINIELVEDVLLNTFAFTNNGTQMSVFSNYNFTSYAVADDGICYATGKDGIYALDISDTDNGKKIFSGLVIKTNNIGTLAYKKIRYVDSGNAGAKLVKVLSANNGSGVFEVEKCGKAYIDKTIEGKDLEIAIDDFDEISQLELFVLPTNRR